MMESRHRSASQGPWPSIKQLLRCLRPEVLSAAYQIAPYRTDFVGPEFGDANGLTLEIRPAGLLKIKVTVTLPNREFAAERIMHLSEVLASEP